MQSPSVYHGSRWHPSLANLLPGSLIKQLWTALCSYGIATRQCLKGYFYTPVIGVGIFGCKEHILIADTEDAYIFESWRSLGVWAYITSSCDGFGNGMVENQNRAWSWKDWFQLYILSVRPWASGFVLPCLIFYIFYFGGVEQGVPPGCLGSPAPTLSVPCSPPLWRRPWRHLQDRLRHKWSADSSRLQGSPGSICPPASGGVRDWSSSRRW